MNNPTIETVMQNERWRGFETACMWSLIAPTWSLTIGTQSSCCSDRRRQRSPLLREAWLGGSFSQGLQMKMGVFIILLLLHCSLGIRCSPRRATQVIHALDIHCILTWNPTMLQKNKNKKTEWIFQSHQTALSTIKNSWHKCTVFLKYVRVKCVALAVAINPNLKDTG